VGGVGNSSTRVVLLGSPSPQSVPNFYKDPDSIIFTEILEFAHSLAPIVKGQDPFNGLPHLQAYRLLRATSLMELGHIKLAGRYGLRGFRYIYIAIEYPLGTAKQSLVLLVDFPRTSMLSSLNSSRA
jgi:hypothetical protein